MIEVHKRRRRWCNLKADMLLALGVDSCRKRRATGAFQNSGDGGKVSALFPLLGESIPDKPDNRIAQNHT